MKFILTETHKDYIKNLILKELKDPSNFSAKEQALRKNFIDKFFKYLWRFDEKTNTGSWVILMFDKGGWHSVTKETMCGKIQRYNPGLCSDPEERDKMIEEIVDNWLNEKKNKKS